MEELSKMLDLNLLLKSTQWRKIKSCQFNIFTRTSLISFEILKQATSIHENLVMSPLIF